MKTTYHWTDEEIQYIKQNLHLSDTKIAAHLNRTKGAVRNKRQVFFKKERKKLHSDNWTPAQIEEYKTLWKMNTDDQLAGQYKVTRRAINRLNNRFGLYRRGPKAEQYNTGTVSIRKNKGREFKWILTAEGWELLHFHLWKEVGREIPPKYALAFKDGNTLNCTLENLEVKRKWQIIVDANPDIIRNRKKINSPELYREYLERKKAYQRAYRQRKREERPAKVISTEKKKAADRERQRRYILKKNPNYYKDIEQRRKDRELKKLLKQQDQERKRQERKIDTKWQAQGQHNKRREKRYQTKEVNLSEKIPVRINAKTVVYVNRGTDIQAVIAKYTNTGHLQLIDKLTA